MKTGKSAFITVAIGIILATTGVRAAPALNLDGNLPDASHEVRDAMWL